MRKTPGRIRPKRPRYLAEADEAKEQPRQRDRAAEVGDILTISTSTGTTLHFDATKLAFVP